MKELPAVNKGDLVYVVGNGRCKVNPHYDTVFKAGSLYFYLSSHPETRFHKDTWEEKNNWPTLMLYPDEYTYEQEKLARALVVKISQLRGGDWAKLPTSQLVQVAEILGIADETP